MACWLQPDEPEQLLNQAATPPWSCGCIGSGTYTTQPVSWKRVSPAEEAAVEESNSPQWDHDVVWCRRPEGAVAIHRFTSRRNDLDSVLDDMVGLARQEMESSDHQQAPTASNIGGFHGGRDLWERPAVQASAMPELIGSAVTLASQYEGQQLRRQPITTTADECWFNVLKPGGWNQLHTHAGSSYSGVLYISDGKNKSNRESGGEERDPLQGRLVLVPNEPEALPPMFKPWGTYHMVHVQPSTCPSSGSRTSESGTPTRRDSKRRRRLASPMSASVAGALSSKGTMLSSAPEFLLIDPTPGTCIIFPSFLPHFVIPTTSSATQLNPVRSDLSPVGAQPQHQSPMRLSAAFNFGHCEPVSVQMWEQQRGRDEDDSYVRVFLEAEKVYGV